MPRKRIMRAFKINEISAVDRPAQEPAKAVLLKRAEPTDPPAPPPNDITTGVTTTFKLSVDKAMGGGKKKKKPMKGSMKRADREVEKLADFLTSVNEGHQHPVDVSVYDGRVSIWIGYAKSEGETGDHSHAVIKDEDGNYVLSENDGHSHTLDQDAVMDRIPKVTKGDGPEGDGDMPDKNDDTTKANAEQVEKLTGEVADLTKRLEASEAARTRADTISSFSDAEREFYSKLEGEDEQNQFIEKSTSERADLIKAASDLDPVVYTSADGREFRKSADPLLVDFAKRLDAQEKENAELRKARETAKYEKRAEDELSHLPGSVEHRAALLKAVDDIKDEEVRKANLEMLHANNSALEKAFVKVGTSGAPSDESDDTSAEARVQKMVQKFKEEDPTLTDELAQAKVWETEEGERLYNELNRPN